MENLPSLTTPDEEKRLIEETRQKALVNLHLLQDEFAVRAMAPTTPTKDLISMAEHAYKVSGLAAKQAEKENDQNRFVFTINFGGQQMTVTAGAVVPEDAPEPLEGTAALVAEADSFLGQIPAYMVAGSGNLQEEL